LTLKTLDAHPWLNNFKPEQYDTYMAEFKNKKDQLDIRMANGNN